ncbi:MAG: NAD(P)H-dependent oxidoreductase [Deltaproteobacteria bacterium]|jgi:multimeric flavodoxin WrbA|nr:NAD(P)H-dependent oxidoreductase [Deltaproteobacteria bacterium]MDL1987851.1 NAD(P)H-dependent oxidoreductase [Deltaproteobacteria bacterium]
MLALGLQGSPRKNGNTSYLLSAFMNELEKSGAQIKVIKADKKKIMPCIECSVCEKEGFCPLDDDMNSEIYPLLRQADVIVVATPIFFYSAPAQLKALIDRSQALWARRYKLKLNDPGQKYRRGFLLALGATRGKNLFEGLTLTIKYFLDAVGASLEGSLTYRQIENPGDMEKHPSVLKEVKEKANQLITPFLGRKKILFACRGNSCRGQIAGAFAQHLAGDKIEVISGGSSPAGKINPLMVEAMSEKGLDMAFRNPKSIKEAVAEVKPDIIITMGCGEECAFMPGVKTEDWNVPDPAGKPIDFMRNIRKEIENRVVSLIKDNPYGIKSK